MRRGQNWSIVPWELHPHVAIIREFVGYSTLDLDCAIEDDDDETYLKSLDPKDWKQQDHYAVLGLKKLRYLATSDQIRKSYRHKILNHHPDKRRFKGEQVKDESHDYFSCITKAFEILGNPTKRYAYDSIDEIAFNGQFPSLEQVKSSFFYHTRNILRHFSRFSSRHPVPDIGYPSTQLAQVEKFYDFWHNYDSSRDFSYLDEEDRDQAEECIHS